MLGDRLQRGVARNASTDPTTVTRPGCRRAGRSVVTVAVALSATAWLLGDVLVGVGRLGVPEVHGLGDAQRLVGGAFHVERHDAVLAFAVACCIRPRVE